MTDRQQNDRYAVALVTMQRQIAAALYLLACGDDESIAKAKRMLTQLVPDLYEAPEDEDEETP